jgi:hypothetical protein
MDRPDPSNPATRAASPAPAWRSELEELYRELDATIARLAPKCELSGRCCRFREYGHTLFVSSPEVELLIGVAPPPVRPVDGGETCPWQDSRGRCTARHARPLGCRVYFCDPAYQDAGQELSERFIGRLKELTQRHRLPWSYAPLHHHLSQNHIRNRLLFGRARSNSEGLHQPCAPDRREAFPRPQA